MTAGDLARATEAAEETGACPVLALGHDQDAYWYLTAAGLLRGLAPRQHSEPELQSLFAGDDGWLMTVFPRTDRGGKNVIGFDLTPARAWLMRGCHEAGFFDPDRDLRGPGAWLVDPFDPASGLVLHLGDRVVVAGDEGRAAGCRIGEFVYPRTRPEPRPARKAAPAAVGRDLVGFLKAWKWVSPPSPAGDLAPVLWAGWIGCAVLTGALPWRPHIYVTGESGTGKNWLDDLAEAILGDAIYRAAAPSAAGIRQVLAGAARPVIVNEVEHDADNRRAQDLIELARLGSSDREGAVVRGSAEGRAQSWRIRGCFCFSGILPPALPPQDMGRVTVLELDEFDRDAEAAPRVFEGIAEFRKQGAALRARMIDGFKRLADNREVYRAAMLDAGGRAHLPEQFAALLAAHDVLVSDAATTAEAAADMAKRLLPSDYAPRRDEEGPEQCLAHLLSSPLDLIEDFSGRRRRYSVGEAVRLAAAVGNKEVGRVLQTYGLRVVADDQGAQWVCVANSHEGLEQLFRGTAWCRKVWRTGLGRLFGSVRGADPVRFAGVLQRATWIPLAYVAADDEADKTVTRP